MSTRRCALFDLDAWDGWARDPGAARAGVEPELARAAAEAELVLAFSEEPTDVVAALLEVVDPRPAAFAHGGSVLVPASGGRALEERLLSDRAVARALEWTGERSHLVHNLEGRSASDARALGLAQELGWSSEGGVLSREHVLRLTLWLDPGEDPEESAAELARAVNLPARLRLCLGVDPRIELTAPSRGAGEARRYCSELSTEPFELSLAPPSSRLRISARQRGASSTTQPTQGAG